MNEFSTGHRWDDVSELLIASSNTPGPLEKSEFLDYLFSAAERHKEVEYYLEHGEWQSTEPLDEEEEEMVGRALLNEVPNQCYHNAQTSFTPNLKYTEGYALTGKHAIPHAWLTLDGKVVEITPTVDADHYFGVVFDGVDVAEAMLERELADPIVEWMVQ